MLLFQNLNPKQRTAFIFTVVAFVAVVIYAVVTSLSRIGKIAVTVQYAPYKTTVSLNGKTVRNRTVLYLAPGDYHVSASLNHFETATRDVTVSADATFIVGVLTPTDQTGQDYVKKHAQEIVDTEGLVGKALAQEGALIKQTYPVLQYLPDNNHLFSISYAYRDLSAHKDPVITIDATPEFLEPAVAKLKLYAKNDDLLQYSLVFKGADNPFQKPLAPASSTAPEAYLKQLYGLNGKDRRLDRFAPAESDYFVAVVRLYRYADDRLLAPYRVVLKRNANGELSLVATPQPLLTRANTPGVPDAVLRSANNL